MNKYRYQLVCLSVIILKWEPFGQEQNLGWLSTVTN